MIWIFRIPILVVLFFGAGFGIAKLFVQRQIFSLLMWSSASGLRDRVKATRSGKIAIGSIMRRVSLLVLIFLLPLATGDLTDAAAQDTVPPSITAPADVIVEATGALTLVSLGTAVVTDVEDTAPTVTNDAPIGGFPVGITVVTWVAEDSSGNVEEADQTVTVLGPRDFKDRVIDSLSGFTNEDKKGKPGDKCGGVSRIVLEYRGDGPVTIEVFLKKDLLISFTDVNTGDLIEILATDETGGKLHPEITLVIDGVEAAKIHTSCSKPIDVGDVHGGAKQRHDAEEFI